MIMLGTLTSVFCFIIVTVLCKVIWILWHIFEYYSCKYIYRRIYIYRCIYKGYKSYTFGHFVQGTVLNALPILTNFSPYKKCNEVHFLRLSQLFNFKLKTTLLDMLTNRTKSKLMTVKYMWKGNTFYKPLLWHQSQSAQPLICCVRL